ncbi:MAG TPA: hypothetical protein DCM08_01810 [Microscillaceae bacterium]|jgi:hypothetical protein|nr:hypothetical protein [Microscillaceae bacterium]
MLRKGFFQRLTTIWFGLIMGQVVFLAVVFFLNNQQDSSFVRPELVGVMDYIAIAFSLGTLGMSQFIPQQLLKVETKDTLDNKLQKYQTSVILRGALIEGGNLFCIVAYLLTQNSLLLGSFAALISIMILSRPTLAQMETSIPLSEDEKAQLQS